MSFDEKAEEWDANPLFLERARNLALEIQVFASPTGLENALDFGCGTGQLSYFLKNDFRTITLADTSKGMLDVLENKIKRENIENFNTLLLDLSVDEFPAHTPNFDIIFSSMAFHHINDIDSVLKRFHKKMNPNGLVCIADLDEEDGGFHHHDPDFNGHKGFAEDQIKSYLINNGFQLRLYKIYHQIVKENQSGIQKTYPVFLIIGQKA